MHALTPLTLQAYFTAPAIAETSKNGVGICTKIKNIVLKAFNSFVYYITCCQVDWREKTVAAPVVESTLSFLKRNHSGRENKFSVTIPDSSDDMPFVMYVWHKTTVDEKEVICMQSQSEFDKKSREQMKSFGFNSEGRVDTIFNDEHERVFTDEHNAFGARGLLKLLDEKCGQKVTTQVQPMEDFETEDQKKEARLKIVQFLTERVFTPDSPHFLNTTHAIPPDSFTLKTCILNPEENGPKVIRFIGQDIEDKPLTILLFVEQDGTQKKIVVNGKERTKDDYAPEAIIWLNALSNRIDDELKRHLLPAHA